MKKRIISLMAALSVALSSTPVLFAESSGENTSESYIETAADEKNVTEDDFGAEAAVSEIIDNGGENEIKDNIETVTEQAEGSVTVDENAAGETADEGKTDPVEAELYDDMQLFSGFMPRTTAPDKNTVYYGSGNPFYQSGIYGWCTWYAWGRVYEILGVRPSLPTSAAGRWFNECNSYPKSTNYYAAKLGAIACYSNHVSVVEAVAANGAPLYVSEGGFQSQVSGQTCTYLTTSGGVNLYFHYGKDYANGFKGYIYILDSPNGGSQEHTHSWSYYNESAHPHRQYRTCSCGVKEYTGSNRYTASCQQCCPLGYVSFTREYNKFAKTATFYRNNVNNADSYEVTLYRDGSYYDSFSMNNSSYTVSNLRSGTYYAALTVKNTSTGQTKSFTTTSFKIVDSYPVTYSANGGSNTPSQQTKIKDEYLTITSSIPVRAHYIFKGWASSKTATEPQYKPGEYYTKNTAITLYAVWEPEVYTISFDPGNGEDEIVSTKITYGNTMKMPNDITYQGYYLKGWSKDKNSQTAEYRIGEDHGFDSDMTLYAVWGRSTWSGEVSDGFSGGTGTENDPYQISSAADLAYLAKKVNEQSSAPEYEYYILTSNIGLGFDEWAPIGIFDFDTQYFYGSFDGNGYTISDLSISQANAGNIGLFGCAKDSEIKDLTLSGEVVNINSDAELNIGELVGYSDNTNITNCAVKYVNISNISNLSAYIANTGCIIGRSDGGEIRGCSAEESNIIVKSGSFELGIICGSSDSDIVNCSVISTSELFETTGTIRNITMGGICGTQTGNIEKCTVNAGRISANDITVESYGNIGGAVGELSGNMSLCTVKFTDDSVKEIEGESYPVSISAASHKSNVGGVVGQFNETARIKDCIYDGKSISSSLGSAYSNVGGLIGEADPKETKSIGVQGGFTLSRSLLPVRDGYKAVWYTDSELENEYDFSTPVTTDMKLYAKWIEREIDIWDGTSTEPEYNAETKTYYVKNGQELAWVGDVTNEIITDGNNFPDNISFEGYTVELTDDIYLNDTSDVDNWETAPPSNQWKPIGDKNSFGGTFNGAHCTVYGIYCYNYYTWSALFGQLTGTIRDIAISDGYINGRSGAGIAATSGGNIINSNNLSVEVCGHRAGGIVYINDGIIENCKNSGDISYSYHWPLSGTTEIGGIAAVNNQTISGCFNSGDINSENSACYLGGIAGEDSGTIQRSANSGYINNELNAIEHLGGIVGNKPEGTVSECYNTGRIGSAESKYMGGIVGCQYEGTINYCYNFSNITGFRCGGIVGYADGEISQCYNTGSVSDSAGGIAGFLIESLRYCHSISSPLCCQSVTGSSVISSYIRSSSAMKKMSGMTGFSANIWAVDSDVNSGYPYLKSLEDTYKTYNVTVIEDMNEPAAVSRSFVNVDGMLFSSSSGKSIYGGDAYAGGIIGYGGGGSQSGSEAKNLLVMADKISAKTTNSTNEARAGDMIGFDNGSFDFNTIFSNSSLTLSAVNTENSSNAGTETIGTPQTDSQLKRIATLNRIFGPDTYQSLEYLNDHPEAVWVIKDGELPELYYNVLRDITLDQVENGSITVDKTQAVDGERVTVTAVPNDGYQLNKIYVNGEIVGDNFVVSGDSTVYATFSEKTPEYTARVETNNNAAASLINVDSGEGISLMSNNDTISAPDGNEIKVNTEADTDHAVESVYINGAELMSESFIITEDTVVTMDVVNISTDISAVTGEATDVGNYFATLSGSVEDVEGAERYIRYWEENNAEFVYTTEVLPGGGEYSVEVTELIPGATYCYQMCETGEVRTFVAEGLDISDPDGTDIPDDPDVPDEPDDPAPVLPVTTATVTMSQTETMYSFEVETEDSYENCYVYAALYDENGILLSVNTVPLEDTAPTTITIDKRDNGAKAKVFIWSETLQPIIERANEFDLF